MNLPQDFPAPYKQGVCLSRHTTFGIGGPAGFWTEPRDEHELASVLVWCRKHRVRVRVIGSGSNILAADRRIAGGVIRLSAPFFRTLRRSGTRVFVGAGTALSQLIRYCTVHGLSGVEFLDGIPGTVGGALAGNAGTRDKAIGDLVEFVSVMDYNGKTVRRTAKSFDFSYRHARFDDCVAVNACLKLARKDAALIRSDIAKFRNARRRTQGAAWKSAGCCFKNPEGESAGRLIDGCGFKGARAGGAVVSRAHANFILNTGNASAADVLALMRRITAAVRKRFGIRLEPEIRIWR